MSNMINTAESRRAFLKKAGIGMAGFAMVGLSGKAAGTNIANAKETDISASTSADSSNDTSIGALGSQIVAVDNVKFDDTCDILIVGAGIAGLTAAITLTREAPDKKVILVEKGSTGAGCSPVCHGDFLFGTADEPYPVQYLKDMATTSTGQTIPDDVLEAFATGINENLPWLYSIGLTEDKLVLRYPYEARDKAEYREFESWASPEGTCNKDNEFPESHLYSYLNSLVSDDDEYSAIDYRTDCQLTSLIKDVATGVVVGGVAGGSTIRTNDGVIMCCGGYEHNEEFLEGFCGCGSAQSFALPGNTGDGHIITAGLGADFWHMHNAAGFWMHPRNLANDTFGTGPLNAHNLKKYGITVGKNGRRFYMDLDGHKFLDTSDDANNTGDPAIDLSLHGGSRHGVMQFGGEWNHMPMPSVGWFVFDQAGLDAGAFDSDYTGSTDPVADGWLLTANTIEELAEQMEVPADQLVATVDQWNEFCDKGADLAFYRPVDSLNPVATAPFYAQRCAPSMLNTDGGPKRNAKGEVLGVDGQPIPGLYSAGEFGSVWGYLYQGNGNVGEALVFGRIAARSCAGLDSVPANDTYEEIYTPEDKTREAMGQ